MDEQIGRLRSELRNLGVDNNTMIWFCSDNGPAGPGGGPGIEKGLRQQGETNGLKSRKGHLYEGGIRVPGILEWPAKIKQHKEINMPVVTSDYMPTIIEALNIQLDSVPEFDGISLVELLFENTKNVREKPIGFQSPWKGDEYIAWIENEYKLK